MPSRTKEVLAKTELNFEVGIVTQPKHGVQMYEPSAAADAYR